MEDSMPIKSLKFGDSLAGLLVDGIDETPFVVATLTYTENQGVRIEVPYAHHANSEQFAIAERWFDTETPPRNLIFMTQDGQLSLFNCRYSGHSMNIGQGFATGYISPGEVILNARDGDLNDELLVSRLSSEIDGLSEWTHFRAIRHERETDEDSRIRRITVTAESVERLSWNQGAATMTLETSWSTSDSALGFQIIEWVALESRFATPTPVSHHLAEQKKLITLLTLMFGKPIYFRRHKIKDARFTDKTLAGKIVGEAFYELVSHRTTRDAAHPKPTARDLGRPIVHMAQIGEDGLRRWNNSYEEWKRFIQPSVSVLSRPGAFIENIVVNNSMSLEAAGNLLGHADGEESTHTTRRRPTTATFNFRALAALGLDWEGVSASITGLAKAIANNYNTIKHYDRGEFPDPAQTLIVSKIVLVIAQLLAVKLVDPSGQLIEDYEKSFSFKELRKICKRQDLYIEDSGEFTNYPS
ncbi:hypothetical protein ACFZAM_02665 [Streptomyces sp. NPDC008079]|uniref:ApeA N-terminal domain 1-containing protein n=1 Tax=Streptomyces sp. NPDC008079 TaxID=3364806 RepID=UPI0036E379F9